MSIRALFELTTIQNLAAYIELELSAGRGKEEKTTTFEIVNL
jgi:hypothetical protein